MRRCDVRVATSGLPLARQERLRQGARTRTEIVAAANKLYAADAR